MAEFFLELFSEEIPAGLQKNLREKLLDDLSKEEQEKAEKASLLTARYLWNFLSGMTSKHKLQTAAA